VSFDDVIPEKTPLAPLKLSTQATLARVGQERATMSIHTTNRASQPLRISQFIGLPWFAKPFLHTMRVVVDGRHLKGEIFLADFL
jgi:hypothetical protein